MNRNYDDIIDLPHPEPQIHPRMPLHDRAAQFSPFAALTGHSAAIAETGRLTDSRVILDEYEMARVDDALQRLQECRWSLPDDKWHREADRHSQRDSPADRPAHDLHYRHF